MSEHEDRILFAGENDCRIEQFTVSASLEADQMLIRNEASLVSAGTELAVLRKRHRAFTSGGEAAATFKYPYYPGYAVVGHVEAVGSSVTDFAVGDLVWHPSSHATVSVARAAQCLPVPEGIEPRDAVFFSLVQIAMTAVRYAPTELGQTVLVSGLGLVGILAGQLYRISGAAVTAADLSQGRLRRGASLGFNPVINLRETSLVEWYAAHPEALPDLSVEAAGIESNIDACLKVTKPGGRVVLLGSPRKPMEIDPYTDIHRKGLTIIGAHAETISPAVRKRDAPYLFSLCRGPLHIDEIRTHELPYTEASVVYEHLEDSPDEYLGVVLTY